MIKEDMRTLSSTRASIPAKRSKTSPPLISNPLLAPSQRKRKYMGLNKTIQSGKVAVWQYNE